MASKPTYEELASRVKELEEEFVKHKRAEDELRRTRDYLESLITHANAPIIVWDTSKKITRFNPAFERLTGYDADEVVGGSLDLLFPETSKVESLDKIGRASSGEFWESVEIPILCNDGQTRIALWNSANVYVRAGKALLATIAQGVDITERIEAQKALKESNERLLIILNSIDAHVYAADMNTHEILIMNKSMRDTFGSNLTGQICYRAFRNKTAPCSFCPNPRIIDEEGNPKGVVTWEDQNPITGRWYINCDRAIHWVDGRTVKLQVATDITSRKDMELQRTELDYRMLQAQKMEAIGTLAGGIAHDFNNILSAIVGYSELALMTTPKNDAAYHNIQEVLTAGERATELVKQILTFARQKETEIKPIQVKLILKEALKLLRASIPSSIEIRETIESNANILADMTQIHQVVMNLCTNAAYAMEDRGGVLTVQLKEVILDKNFTDHYPTIFPGNYMQLHVEDTGCGIRPDILEKIFDPYFTTKGTGEGTGLGLSVVKGIVDKLDGLITVRSELGSGSMFDVYFPVLERKAKAITSIAAEKEAPTGDERILFIDDEYPIAEIGKKFLEPLGYHVTVRTSPIEALELFKSDPNRFDLVITDMTMPQMTGDLLAIELHKIRPDVPLILCTGFSKRLSDERASDLGIKALLMKPIVKMELAKTVRKVLDKVKG